MKKIIPKSSILACGVWHKAPNTKSSLDEAIAALGEDCIIINGNMFTGSKPDEAYAVGGVLFSQGGVQFGYAMKTPNDIRYDYLNQAKFPSFIGASYVYLHSNGKIIGTFPGTARRAGMGLMQNGDVYINLTSSAMTAHAFVNQAKADGCATFANLDGGGSRQFHLPDGTNDYGTDPKRKVLNWVYFKIKEDKPVGVNQYSKKADGGLKLTPHFKVSEFACRDGSDKILIDSALVAVLEDIRAACGNKPVNVNSGYRTPAYNSTVGGAPDSYHLKGMAVDITISGVSTETICKAAEAALKKRGIQGGIGRYVGQGFVHVDVRPVRSRFQQDKSGQAVYSVAGWDGTPAPSMPTIRRGAKGDAVKTLQTALNAQNKAGLKVDSDFGTLTEKAVLAFQRAKGLVVDGIVGPKTWVALGL